MITTHLETLTAIARHLEDQQHQIHLDTTDHEVRIIGRLGQLNYRGIDWRIRVDDDKITFYIADDNSIEFHLGGCRSRKSDISISRTFELANPASFNQITQAIIDATNIYTQYLQLQKTITDLEDQFATDLKTYKDKK